MTAWRNENEGCFWAVKLDVRDSAKFSSIPGTGQAENMHSVSRFVQQKSLGDVVQTQEIRTAHSFRTSRFKHREKNHTELSLGWSTTLKFVVTTPVPLSCARNSLEHGRVTRQQDIGEPIPCG